MKIVARAPLKFLNSRKNRMTNVNSAFFELVRHVVNGDADEVSSRLAADPSLAVAVCGSGASRGDAANYFFTEISHYLYAGDTALHMASAAFQPEIARMLVERGADIRAKNRRRAEPLHYAADTNHWEPDPQAATIAYLLSVGAYADAADMNGARPLHRAVRTRSSPAVRALLDGGADVTARNNSGSTPLHLAVQTTGRGGTGSEQAREQQSAIIKLLIERGAKPSDTDGRGKTVTQPATSEWILDILK